MTPQIREIGIYPDARVGPRRGTLAVLRDRHGMTGIGEASPLVGHSPETLEAANSVLERFDLALLPPPIPAPRWEATLLTSFQCVAEESPAAAMALETAWIDLAAQQADLPFAAFLSGEMASGARVPVNVLVNSLDQESSLHRIKRALSAGITTVKLKATDIHNVQVTLDMIASIRREWGDAVSIRVDANGAWPLDLAMPVLKKLADWGVEYCEQPVPRGELRMLSPSPVPLAADESLTDMKELEAFLGIPAKRINEFLRGLVTPEDVLKAAPEGFSPPVKVFVLKPMVLGGILRSRRIARIAAERGIRYTVTHLFDGATAFAAYAEFAVSLQPPPLACGLFPHDATAAAGTVDDSHFDGSCVRSAHQPGLGVNRGAILDAALDR
ncbi:MAG TPA: enolase C-terminal domain-like protein [Candidatus Latescibacteria bacterium]|nr:enolase C-terminal domain-like protein [Candidatus Latescibacterota bacterium]